MLNYLCQDRAMASTRSPRTGRRPGASGTREAILDAARRLFPERGYDGTTLRAVAADAGVDSALVVHFFKGKAGLYIAAMQWPFDPQTAAEHVTARGAERVGERAVTLFVETWDREGDGNAIISLLQSAMADRAAAKLLRDFMQHQLFEPAIARLEVDQPELRADLVSSQLLGLGVARYVLKFEPLASLPAPRVIRAVAPRVQQYATGPLG
jgi:AcrR family transcriptional regulator